MNKNLNFLPKQYKNSNLKINHNYPSSQFADHNKILRKISKVDNKISMLLGAISAGFAIAQIGNKFYYSFQTLKKHLTHIFT